MNRPLRTRMLGGVGTEGEKPSVTRFGSQFGQHLDYFNVFKILQNPDTR